MKGSVVSVMLAAAMLGHAPAPAAAEQMIREQQWRRAGRRGSRPARTARPLEAKERARARRKRRGW